MTASLNPVPPSGEIMGEGFKNETQENVQEFRFGEDTVRPNGLGDWFQFEEDQEEFQMWSVGYSAP